MLGVRDYVGKNRFPGVAIGLSGGIDSALTLCIAVDALGAERVEALMMPSRFTATMSLEDAATQAKAMGVTYHSISIEPMFEAFMAAAERRVPGRARDVTEENIQARIRGTLLMAVSNKTGKMVLTTGNKSEMAVGYATLYGDMAGGYGAIKDVFKTMVYRLAEYRNRSTGDSAPRVRRAPSAELAPDQKDSDSLPSYDVLDPILERYVEKDQSPEAIIAAGFDAATVRRVAGDGGPQRVQAPPGGPGVRITRRAFGRDRRYPITSGLSLPGRCRGLATRPPLLGQNCVPGAVSSGTSGPCGGPWRVAVSASPPPGGYSPRGRSCRARGQQSIMMRSDFGGLPGAPW